MTEKPKIKVIKANSAEANRRSGLMTVTDDTGRERFRTTCDSCSTQVVLRRAPRADEAIYCRKCREIHQVGKPGTVLVTEKGRTKYRTPCDFCGTEVTVSFLPKTDRPFQCTACYKSNLAESEAEAKAEAKEKQGLEDSLDQEQKPVRSFRVQCRTCRKAITLKFQPKEDERIQCTECYTRKHSDRTRPSLIYNIECSKCGQKEALDLVPSDPENALCTNCLNEAKAQRRR